MKKVLPFLLLFFLCACSWQQYFVVKNNSATAITISYQLTADGGFAIFDEQPQAFYSTRRGEINWERPVIIEDKDSSKLGISVVLPPHVILKIGQLSNDHYERHDQEFINGRFFNLEEMQITKKEGVVKIPGHQFDHFFGNKNGAIACEVK